MSVTELSAGLDLAGHRLQDRKGEARSPAFVEHPDDVSLRNNPDNVTIGLGDDKSTDVPLRQEFDSSRYCRGGIDSYDLPTLAGQNVLGVHVSLNQICGKRRLAGDTARAATTDEVKQLRREAQDLKEVVAEQALELRLLKKSMIGDGGDQT